MAEAHTQPNSGPSNCYDADTTTCKEVIQQGGLVMLDFWSEHCGPCRSLMPLMSELANKHPQLTILKVEIENNDSLADEFNVQSIPSLLLFKEGDYLDRLIGKTPYPLIDKLIKKHTHG
jgi:thioredoxin